MPTTYTNPRYPAVIPPAARSGEVEHQRVVVAGAGLVGLTLALDLAYHGIPSVVLDEDDTVSFGSRAICFAKRTLEIYGRLGLGQRMLAKGITWKTGRVFHGNTEAYSFDLLPEEGHEYPAFINLQQYYAEEWLVEACAATGLVEIRWKNRITAVENRPDAVHLWVETPEGDYTLHAEWLLACDGARSFIREALGLPFEGKVFRDRFLIADVLIDKEVDFPTERWFWFDPPFHPGQSVLLHKQPDGVWRIDFQLGWDADPEEEKRPEKVIPRVAAMLGPDVPFALEWVSIYTFRCRRLARFTHGRTIFAGDSAHQVSPFGARGGNGGVQDADNLAWKLAAVLKGEAPAALLDSYDAERIPATDENILHSTRATDFITPKTPAARAYRDAVLDLARRFSFARPWVNSGRLSRPAVLANSPLNTPDDFPGGAVPGSPAPDAPVLRAGQPDWLLRHLGGRSFTLLVFGPPRPIALPAGVVPLFVTDTDTPDALWDHAGLARRRFGLPAGAAVLLRPDQHVAARFATPDPEAIGAAHARALGRAAPMLQRAA
jgi:3-(3-hydroxy-phenyl)propionate hydroxylase